MNEDLKETGLLRSIFIPPRLSQEDLQSLVEAFPFRLRLTASFALTLFLISNIPDYLLAPELFWKLFAVTMTGAVLFIGHILIIRSGRSFSYYLALTYAQVITATAVTGTVVYLSGGCESEWALAPGLVILVSGLILPMPIRVISIISLISASGYAIPTLLCFHPAVDLYKMSTHLFYYTAFISIGIAGAYSQFIFLVRLTRQMSHIRNISRTLREKDEDLTRKNRELLIQTERAMESNRLKSEFLANISHELRTPLTSVIGFSGILREKLDDSPDNCSMVEQIAESGDQLLTLVDDLIDLSQIDAGKIQLSLESADTLTMIKEIVDSIQGQVSGGRRIVEVDCPGRVSDVNVDRSRIVQALFKIMQNAIKFTETGSRILIGCRDAGDSVEIFISDNGVGMTEEQMAVIFDRFRQLDGSSTRKHGGMGIGLCIAKSVVELQGGHIRVESEVGKGSTFRITLPKAKKDLA